jgi:hypothetical protein
MVARAEPGRGWRRGDNAGGLEPENERWSYETAAVVLVLAASVEKVDMVEPGVGWRRPGFRREGWVAEGGLWRLAGRSSSLQSA